MKHVRIVLTLLFTVMIVLSMVGPIYADDSGKININTASAEELVTLNGIGESYAVKIVEYRKTKGPFKSPEEIMNVKGIGAKTYEQNKDKITVQ